MDEELLWKSRVLEERAQELVEWKMITTLQLESQIERLQKTLERQKIGNSKLKEHLQMLNEEMESLVELKGKLA